jgi:hypothetical protein
MDVKYKYVQQILEEQEFQVKKVEGTDNIADLLTKPVSLQVFRYLCPRMMKATTDTSITLV